MGRLELGLGLQVLGFRGSNSTKGDHKRRGIKNLGGFFALLTCVLSIFHCVLFLVFLLCICSLPCLCLLLVLCCSLHCIVVAYCGLSPCIILACYGLLPCVAIVHCGWFPHLPLLLFVMVHCLHLVSLLLFVVRHSSPSVAISNIHLTLPYVDVTCCGSLFFALHCYCLLR